MADTKKNNLFARLAGPFSGFYIAATTPAALADRVIDPEIVDPANVPNPRIAKLTTKPAAVVPSPVAKRAIPAAITPAPAEQHAPLTMPVVAAAKKAPWYGNLWGKPRNALMAGGAVAAVALAGVVAFATSQKFGRNKAKRQMPVTLARPVDADWDLSSVDHSHGMPAEPSAPAVETVAEAMEPVTMPAAQSAISLSAPTNDVVEPTLPALLASTSARGRFALRPDAHAGLKVNAPAKAAEPVAVTPAALDPEVFGYEIEKLNPEEEALRTAWLNAPYPVLEPLSLSAPVDDVDMTPVAPVGTAMGRYRDLVAAQTAGLKLNANAAAPSAAGSAFTSPAPARAPQSDDELKAFARAFVERCTVKLLKEYELVSHEDGVSKIAVTSHGVRHENVITMEQDRITLNEIDDETGLSEAMHTDVTLAAIRKFDGDIYVKRTVNGVAVDDAETEIKIAKTAMQFRDFGGLVDSKGKVLDTVMINGKTPEEILGLSPVRPNVAAANVKAANDAYRPLTLVA